MARRKKKSTVHPQLIKTIIIIIVVLLVLAGLWFGTVMLFKKSQIFTVKSVSIDSSLNFISKRDYSHFIGKNIFDIDLEKNNKRLSYKYPQVDGLKLVRQFPDRILLVAKQRLPYAQILSNDKVYTIDEYGILLSTTSRKNDSLPKIINVRINPRDVFLGKKMEYAQTRDALMIISHFKNAKTLSSYSIRQIDIDNSSKINIKLTNGLDIIMNNYEIGYKISILNLLLSQHKFSPKDTKYIDLRFKEPVIGKK